MRVMHVAVMAALCTGGVYGQDPPKSPDKDSQERKEQMDRLEAEIRDMEAALKSKDVPDERRDELKRRLGEKYAQLKELRRIDPWWGGKEPKGDLAEKARRLEGRIRDLEKALHSKELGPEDRKELTSQLHHARAQMDELRGQMKQDPLAKGPGMFGGHPPPMDPESQKLHMEAQELDHVTMDLGARLRRLPKDSKDERAEVASKLKETVVRLFDVRERLRAREVELIKKRLEELTQMLDKRKVNRDAIIEKRVKQLSGESDDLDW